MTLLHRTLKRDSQNDQTTEQQGYYCRNSHRLPVACYEGAGLVVERLIAKSDAWLTFEVKILFSLNGID